MLTRAFWGAGCPDGEASTVPRAEKLSPAADVHAFGVLMLEVVTRANPNPH